LLARRSARDDHLIVCLRFLFLLITRLTGWLRLSRCEQTWKTAEILILRRQLAVLQRPQPRHPKLNRADRALLAAPVGSPAAGPKYSEVTGQTTSMMPIR